MWNWNLEVVQKILGHRETFNQTNVELKQQYSVWRYRQGLSFNQTNVELKHGSHAGSDGADDAF